MSTGCECEFFVFNGKHYYALERYNAPKNSWDWTDYADVYGPFDSLETAIRHLSDNHANPGGWSEHPDDTKDSENYQKLVAKAIRPAVRDRYGFRRFHG